MSFRLSAEAQQDVADALDWSLANFGEDAFKRYSNLLRVSFADIVEDPLRIGSSELEVGGQMLRLYPIKFSRQNAAVAGRMVFRPRHVLAYRVGGEEKIEILRVLHDRMDVTVQFEDGV
jgi:toxin ParE1/3/4